MNDWSKSVRRLMGSLMLVYKQMDQIEERETRSDAEVELKRLQLKRLEIVKEEILIELKKIK